MRLIKNGPIIQLFDLTTYTRLRQPHVFQTSGNNVLLSAENNINTSAGQSGLRLLIKSRKELCSINDINWIISTSLRYLVICWSLQAVTIDLVNNENCLSYRIIVMNVDLISFPQRTAYIRRSNRPKAENIYTKNLDVLRKAIISSLITVISAVHETNNQLCQGKTHIPTKHEIRKYHEIL